MIFCSSSSSICPYALRLGERMREQVQDELLVGLAARVDADVRERRRGQQAAHEIERLRANRARVRRRRLVVGARELLGGPRGRPLEQPRVRRRRGRRARARTAARSARRGSSGSRSRRAARRRRCSASTARGRRRAAGAAGSSSAGSTSTRRRCARRRAARPSRRRSRGRSARRASAARSPSLALDRRRLGNRVGELVEEEPAQRPLVARVAGEERALDRLRQVDEPEHRPVEVREVRREPLALLVGEASRPELSRSASWPKDRPP